MSDIGTGYGTPVEVRVIWKESQVEFEKACMEAVAKGWVLHPDSFLLRHRDTSFGLLILAHRFTVAEP